MGLIEDVVKLVKLKAKRVKDKVHGRVKDELKKEEKNS